MNGDTLEFADLSKLQRRPLGVVFSIAFLRRRLKGQSFLVYYDSRMPNKISGKTFSMQSIFVDTIHSPSSGPTSFEVKIPRLGRYLSYTTISPGRYTIRTYNPQTLEPEAPSDASIYVSTEIEIPASGDGVYEIASCIRNWGAYQVPKPTINYIYHGWQPNR